MKKANIRKPIFALSLTTLLSVALGYGEWVIIASQKLNSPATSSEKKVCSIGNTYYTTVEAALTAAESNPGADTIYVIPGANPTLSVNSVTGKNTFFLPSNDKMIVAFYSDVDKKTVYANSKKGINTNQSAITIKNTLTIGSGVTLKIEGTLETSGRLNAGDGGQAYAGNTYGDCTRILLDANAKITCSGTINCYGYIEETTTDNGSSLEMASGSNLNMPFVMRDFRGGSSTKGIYAEKDSRRCFPFNQYELSNISVKTTLLHGTILSGFTNINAGGSVQTIEELKMVGPDKSYLFQTINSGNSKIVYRHVPNTSANDGNPLKGKSEITFIGGANFNSISLSLLGKQINSSEYYFPLNHYFSFKFVNPEGVEKSSFSIPSMTKVMPGCNFEIGENCNVSIGDMIIYSVFNDDPHEKTDSIQRVGGTPYPSLEPVMFWNKGTINATDIAGCVINDGTINIAGKKALTSYEPWAQSGSFISTTITQWITINANYSEFTSDSFNNNKRVLIYTKNIDNANAVSYNYQSKNLNGYYTDYVTANTSISLSNWTNIASITINGNPYSDGSNYSVNGPTKIEVVPTAGSGEGGGGCFAKGMLIMIADGSYKKVENLRVGDIIKSFNHETGLLENQFITYIPYHQKAIYQVLDLVFENNHRIKVLFAHGFMNTSTRMYEEISPFNVDAKLGQSYLFIENNKLVNRKLISYSIYNEETECYSLCTAYNLNHIVEGALCVADDIGGLYNYFDLDESYKYDVEKKEKDIERYGLLRYEDVSYILSREIYELFNVKYLSVSIGKGLTTMEQLEGYIIKFG